ncbi:RDD family protein [Candidatus Foliamicus sp.]
MNDSPDVGPLYGGFWIRIGALVLDSLLLFGITFMAVRLLYGQTYMEWVMESAQGMTRDNFFFTYVLPAIYTLGFWIIKSATVGKMLVKVKIVNANTGKPASPLQCIVRYLGYFVSALPLGLGFLWVAFDKRKQGWHDKIARTLVVSRARPVAQ